MPGPCEVKDAVKKSYLLVVSTTNAAIAESNYHYDQRTSENLNEGLSPKMIEKRFKENGIFP